MQELEQRKQEIENQINSLIYPLTPLQTIKLDNLKKELNRIKTQIFIKTMKGLQTNE